MSIDIQWNLLDEQIAEKLRAKLDTKIAKLSLPRYIQDLHITSFDFGTSVPDVTIQDICDPDPRLYEETLYSDDSSSLDDEESDREEENMTELPPYGATENGVHKKDSTDVNMNHTQTSNQQSPQNIAESNIHKSVPNSAETPSFLRNSIGDVQIIAHVQYSGNMTMSMEACLAVNYPSKDFAMLPFTLQLSDIVLDGTLVVALIASHVHVCFVDTLEHNRGDVQSSIIKNIRVDSVVGEPNKQVLKNVAKVEKFVVQKICQIVEDEFVWPSYFTLY
ncbi:Mdm10/Mdm12/Mmm1 complex subunit Mdm12 [Schizosaccharomyces japonicus yFS275]|uniref:Mitochondrial distribution and morphology protein 12 n=1 Tax=Schizosaccharomyces japonicus (strain yFS275 / FY16936) TaxID=402676 RepID=MDM12_SCHJY|nr:Mdm10/Mdm12/Mmm1 complex subunit Mdm12 [Schizosaccharomyces japonicus yFS275]B6K4Z5.1 RecName: Full=Mitochondrial distribution and morphology protein 12; AltName: Full=Mitochondrial inheritance component mdm12 [Schizosaccharomyces japonicus yFS275]EEB08552.1 Mdm10/Mdm12/Mmm1 complex subunit Mdm12 [Schizosaccharomyces japonicus yFS275]